MNFLKKNYDIFAWSQGDVLGIDPQVTVHKLFIDLNHLLFFQKRRKLTPKCLKVIEEEVVKFIKVNVIREAHYLDWLANVVVALKKGGNGEYALISLTSTRLVQKTVFLCQR